MYILISLFAICLLSSHLFHGKLTYQWEMIKKLITSDGYNHYSQL